MPQHTLKPMTELQWACHEAEKHPGTCTMLRKHGGVWTAEIRCTTHNGYNAINLGYYPCPSNTIMATVLTELRHALTNGHQVTNAMLRDIDAALNIQTKGE